MDEVLTGFFFTQHARYALSSWVSLYKSTRTLFRIGIFISDGNYVTQLKFYLCHFKAHSNSLQSGSYSVIFGSSRYSYLLDWRREHSSVERLGIIGYMTRLISKLRRPASFFAYFRPDFPEILRLICCHTHLTKAERPHKFRSSPHPQVEPLCNWIVVRIRGFKMLEVIPWFCTAHLLLRITRWPP